jgi:hypothetical protein
VVEVAVLVVDPADEGEVVVAEVVVPVLSLGRIDTSTQLKNCSGICVPHSPSSLKAEIHVPSS